MTRTRLNLESLNDRIVPATLNLTTAGATGTLNGAIFTQLAPGANGSDPTDTFLTLQERTLFGSLLTPEEGYNTDARPNQLDAIGGPDETRALQLDEAPIIMQGGVAYREFLLTVRSPAFAPNVILDELRIFVGETPDVRGYNNTTNSLAGLPVAFNLDAGVNNRVRINDNLNRSGTADVAVLIPELAFTAAGATSSSFIYLYSSFSATPLTSVLSGPEAWSVRELPDPPPPSGGNLTLSGFVKHVAGAWDPGANEGGGTLLGGIGGVTIFLLDADGAMVLDENEMPVTAVTDANGYFEFTGLEAGTYGIMQEFDEEGNNYINGQNFVGNSGGDIVTLPETENDTFLNIQLAEDVDGVDYYFTETGPGT